MSVQAMNVAEATAALVNALRSDVRLDGVSVSRAQELNESPAACPWVGVYRDSARFYPRTLGVAPGFMNHEISFVVSVQAAGGGSGEDCEDMLEALIANVASVILSDPSLGGTVMTIKEMTVQYRDYSRVDNVYMQTAALYLTAETRVTVS